MLEKRVEIHKRFWAGDALDAYPASFRIGDYFFADKFKAAAVMLEPGKKLEPDMLNVDKFLDDYERIYLQHEATGQVGFWTAEPFTAIPWMEAIFGCQIFGERHSFVTEPVTGDFLPDGIYDNLTENPWFLKYMEFSEKLVKSSNGRFPVGQPIMRGIADVMGAVLGQTRMIYEIYDNPSFIKKLAQTVCRTFLKIIEEQYKLLNSFHGGFAIGFYHIWTPGKCIWFQDDLTALLSPGLYRDLLLSYHEEICKSYEYSLIHLHPSSFHIVNELLSIKDLKAVEVNKDVGGPSVAEMLPILETILAAGKRLVLWGTLDENDISVISVKLPHQGIYLNIVTESIETAKAALNRLYIKSASAGSN